MKKFCFFILILMLLSCNGKNSQQKDNTFIVDSLAIYKADSIAVYIADSIAIFKADSIAAYIADSIAIFKADSIAVHIADSLAQIFPKERATHVVELFQVQIGANDFNLSTFGNPLDIHIYIKENGRTISSVTPLYLYGTRGERILSKPIVWVVNFNPEKNYQIVVTEESIIAATNTWAIPETPKIGYWPFGFNGGKLYFGKDSYLLFRDKVAK
ncbi:MAG: hypothetical protein KAT14_08375 [Candidatus Marinimicrobia bacterium]|nr:hypothetical protein [Candidatus Neomarinimicrobiota bacterium]